MAVAQPYEIRIVKWGIVLLLAFFLEACSSSRSSWHRGFSREEWSGSVQCAPYARKHSNIKLVGNAASWWWEARGRYRRSHRPHRGDVLVFRASRRLPLGHVCVVRQVRGSRLVLVDHANWEPGVVTRRAPIVDVSPRNNWTRVRVWWTPTHAVGKTVYSTYGFIEP